MLGFIFILFSLNEEMNVDISHLHVQNLPWAPVYMSINLLIISFCTHVIVFLSAHPKLNLPSTTKTKTKNPTLLGVCIDSSITIYEVHATMLGNEVMGGQKVEENLRSCILIKHTLFTSEACYHKDH